MWLGSTLQINVYLYTGYWEVSIEAVFFSCSCIPQDNTNITCTGHVKAASASKSNNIHLVKDPLLIKWSDFVKKEIDKISTDPTNILMFEWTMAARQH